MDQQIGAGLLHLLPVEPRDKRQTARVRDLVGGDDPGSKRSGRRKILARRHGDFLIIAYAAVDEAGVAGDVLERACDRDMAAAPTDDDRELAFEVETLRHRGADHLGLMAGERSRKPNEHARLLGHFASGFRGMRAIVDAGAQDLLGIRDHRQPSNLAEPVVGLSRLGGLPNFRERASGEGVTQGRVAMAQALVQGEHAIADDHAEAGLAIGDIACKLHSPLLWRAIAGLYLSSYVIPAPKRKRIMRRAHRRSASPMKADRAEHRPVNAALCYADAPPFPGDGRSER